jgi:hypothetical protein
MLEYGATLGRAEEIMERLPENVRKLVSHASVAGETEVEGVAFRGFACH